MVDEAGEDVWYTGLVTSVLDDDEFDDECEFQAVYDGYDEEYDVELVKE